MLYWDRATLKDRAKNVLRKSYWVALLVVVVYSILTLGSNGMRYSFDLPMTNDWRLSIFEYKRFFVTLAASVVTIVGALVILYKAFVANPLKVGKAGFFTLCRYEKIKFGELFGGFKRGYAANVKTMFLRDVFTFLWSLIFVIPGIVKYYSYWMIPYILAENPDISTERAFEISKLATSGEKFDMFVLHLSFIGWMILAAMFAWLTFGFSALAINPYMEATNAELYGALRYKAVINGICTRDEIGADIEEILT